MHQVLEQSHSHGTQSLSEAQTNLAVIERERSLLVERLAHTERQLSNLATAKQLLVQDNAVLSSQLAAFRAKNGQL